MAMPEPLPTTQPAGRRTGGPTPLPTATPTGRRNVEGGERAYVFPNEARRSSRHMRVVEKDPGVTLLSDPIPHIARRDTRKRRLAWLREAPLLPARIVGPPARVT
jgi:hypothetical protein